MTEQLTRRSKNALYVAFTTAGVVAGLIGRDLIDGPQPVPPVGIAQGAGDVPTSEPLYMATMASDLHDALFPSPTATGTPYPTSTPTPDPYTDKNFCRTDSKDGELCKVPYPPPPTPTPYPKCDSVDLTPGDWCVVGKGGA